MKNPPSLIRETTDAIYSGLYFTNLRTDCCTAAITNYLTGSKANCSNYSVFPFLWRVVYKLSSEVGCGEVTNPK